jgi:restriction system protein
VKGDAVAIPDFQTIMLPFLRVIGDGKEHWLRDIKTELAKYFALSPEELQEKLPSGKQTVFENRVGWARTFLKNAGLIEYVQRGYPRITKRGETALNSGIKKIDVAYLKQFPEFLEWQKSPAKTHVSTPDLQTQTPQELIESGYSALRKQVESDLLKLIKASSPESFEKLVVKLLLAMGYGGTQADAGDAIGKSGDGGVDGVIKEDKLGLELLYIQAKRWDTGTVGRPEIQKFVGALQGKKARKGVFITTSKFTAEALDYASSIETKVVLIDGQKLTDLMFDHNVGVETTDRYEVKMIDSDFFEDEDQ